MKISNTVPPNFEAIVKVFPHVIANINIVYTYGDTIHVPSGKPELMPDLLAHEEIHFKQQTAPGMTPEKWWAKYLKDPKFRLEQEIQAYQTQYLMAKSKYARSRAKNILKQVAGDLSSGLYGDLLTFDEAKKLIEEAEI